jgi:hypothetical protein
VRRPWRDFGDLNLRPVSRFYVDQIGEAETAFKNWEAAVRLQIAGNQTAHHAAVTL